MKLTRVILLITLIIFSAIVTVSAEEKQAAVIESISYEKNGTQGEMVKFMLNGMYLPKIFAIKGEKPRLVLDFVDTDYSDLTHSVIETEGELVKRLRIGIHKGQAPKTRVVVDMAPGIDFAFDQDFAPKDNILMVSISPVAKEQTGADIKSAASEKNDQKAEQKQPEERKAEQISQGDTAVVPTEKIYLKKEKSKQVFVVSEKALKVDKRVEPDAELPAYPSADEVFRPAKKEKVDVPIDNKAKPVAVEAIGSPVLLDVSFDGTSNKGEMVKFRLNEFSPPVVFGMEKENPSVVCDFLDTSLSENVPLEIESHGVYVDRVRTTKLHNPEKIRVVLDLLPNKNYDLQQVFFKEDNLFVIIVNSFNAPEDNEAPSAQ